MKDWLRIFRERGQQAADDYARGILEARELQACANRGFTNELPRTLADAFDARFLRSLGIQPE